MSHRAHVFAPEGRVQMRPERTLQWCPAARSQSCDAHGSLTDEELVSLPRPGLRPVLDQLSKVWGESYRQIFRYFDGCPKMGKNGVILVPKRRSDTRERNGGAWSFAQHWARKILLRRILFARH